MDPQLTIAEASRLIASRALSPVELAQSCLDRIAAIDPVLDSFLLVTGEAALAEAKASEARIMAGTPRSPLDGIPIAHKDIYNTAGLRTTAHSRLLQDHVPDHSATTVTKLADAGTVMLGKLATHEFAFGGPSFDLPWPPARNPWNREHFSGGSSSGAGVAIAAGLILGGTGSDTGGSIRIPAALSGLVGIKPTYGLCSRSGIIPLSDSLDHAGPLAWTVEDCAMLLQQMAGYDATDTGSANRPLPDFCAGIGASIKGLRIGVVRSFHEQERPVSPATAAGIEAACAVFRAAGADVADIAMPSLRDYQACGYIILLSEAFARHANDLRTRFFDYGRLMRERLALGAFITGEEYLQAVRLRTRLCQETAAAMEGFDILLTATMPGEAMRLDVEDKWSNLGLPNFNMPANVTGYPAISVCSGFGEGGLPVAIQLIARPFAEPQLFSVAHAYEAATPWRNRRPDISLGVGRD